MVSLLALLFLILPLSSSLPISTCDLCPAQSTCVFDDDGHPSCLCDDGFAGDLCEIPLCHEYFCFGQLSVCENTLQGPLCHCERGRTGSNCELYKGETAPWSSCANATFCEASFQNGKCDEICNNAECLFDGNDCQTEYSIYAKEDADPSPQHNWAPLIESQDSLSIPLDLVLSVFSCVFILISLCLLVKIRRSSKQSTHVIYTLPPSQSTLRHESSNYYLENSFDEVGYATVPEYVIVPYQATPALSVIYEDV